MDQSPHLERDEEPGLATAIRGAARPRGKRRLRWWLAALGGLAAAGIAASGIIDRQNNVSQLATLAKQRALPKVALVSPAAGPKTRPLTLPGNVMPWYRARIYAQVSGYVEAWYKDYGAPVSKGELLARISTPALDQQLQQARAQLDVAQQKYDLAKLTAQRWQKLEGSAAVSQQVVDVYAGDAKAQEAALQAAKYNLERYNAQEAFKQVVAPFNGVVTQRFADVGSYVEATGGNAEQRGVTQELFTVADIHKLRIYVSVPQDYSAYIEPGLSATMTLSQFPGQSFRVTLTATAHAFESTSRTVLTEFTMDNPDRKIWPGSYADVHLELPTHPGILVIPEQSLLFRSQGLQVALVKNNKVRLQTVTIGFNFGQTVQVIAGLKPSDRLIANPSAGLLDGQAVQVVDAPPQNSGLSDHVNDSVQQASDK
jgi:membrane fusion protein (multidrug efflux system)